MKQSAQNAGGCHFCVEGAQLCALGSVYFSERKSEAARTALPASPEPVGRPTVGVRSGRGSARAGGAASSRSSLQPAALGAQEQMAALRAAGPPSNPPLIPAAVPGARPPSRSARARPRQGLLRTENWGGLGRGAWRRRPGRGGWLSPLLPHQQLSDDSCVYVCLGQETQ